MRIIANESVHQILHVGRPNELEVIEDQPLLCKVLAKGNKSPCIFRLEFRGDNQRRQMQDLIIYMSNVNREPNEQDCDKKIHQKQKFVFSSKIDDKFDSNSVIYLSLCSKLGCSITLSVSFPIDSMGENGEINAIEQRKKVVKIKEKRVMEDGREVEVEVDHDIRDIEETFDCKINFIFTLNLEIIRKFKDSQRLASDNFINKNKMLTSRWDEIKES